MSNQSRRQQSVRELTGTALDHNGDWHALFDQDNIAPGTFNEHMIAWLNAQTGETFTGLPAAQMAYAKSLGAMNWDALTEIGFNPASLFRNDESGIWLDPSDLSTLYQERTGATTPATIGDPVGTVLDKSGNDNHATAPSDAARPTLQQTAEGFYYLSFDGVDDALVTPTITPGTDKVQVFAGLRKLSDVAAGVVLETSATHNSNNGSILVTAPESLGGGGDFRFKSRGTTSVQNRRISLAPVTHVLSGISDISASLNRFRIDGVLNGDETGSQGTGGFLAYPAYIGSRAGTSLFFNGHIYGLIARFGPNLDTQTIERVEKYVARKTPGVDL